MTRAARTTTTTWADRFVPPPRFCTARAGCSSASDGIRRDPARANPAGTSRRRPACAGVAGFSSGPLILSAYPLLVQPPPRVEVVLGLISGPRAVARRGGARRPEFLNDFLFCGFQVMLWRWASCCGCVRDGGAGGAVRSLDYARCSLHDVPAEVFEHERTLEELRLDSNRMRDLPRPLFLCQELRLLSVADNDVAQLPPAVGQLPHLQFLDARRNALHDVPADLKACKKLRSVNLQGNPLVRLPEALTQLVALQVGSSCGSAQRATHAQRTRGMGWPTEGGKYAAWVGWGRIWAPRPHTLRSWRPRLAESHINFVPCGLLPLPPPPRPSSAPRATLVRETCIVPMQLLSARPEQKVIRRTVAMRTADVRWQPGRPWWRCGRCGPARRGECVAGQ